MRTIVSVNFGVVLLFLIRFFIIHVHNFVICQFLIFMFLSIGNCIPGGYSHTLPIWVSAAQRGRDFEAPDLEWGIHFRGVF